jgi:hypothetical protein
MSQNIGWEGPTAVVAANGAMAIGHLPVARSTAAAWNTLPSVAQETPSAAAAAPQQPVCGSSYLMRTTSAPEAGNGPPQPRRGGFPRYGSSTIDDVRGMIDRGELPGLNAQTFRPPVPQQSLARRADSPTSAARDPLAWRQGLRLAAAAPDAPHMAELRSAAQAIESELSSEYAPPCQMAHPVAAVCYLGIGLHDSCARCSQLHVIA